jgi:hypothetical protein
MKCTYSRLATDAGPHEVWTSVIVTLPSFISDFFATRSGPRFGFATRFPRPAAEKDPGWRIMSPPQIG